MWSGGVEEEAASWLVRVTVMSKHVVLEHIVAVHAEEAAFQWLLRDRAVRAPHYTLRDLLKFDNRLEAHLDGLRIAGEAGWDLCRAQLEGNQPGEMFAPMVLALVAGDNDKLGSLLTQAETVPCGRRAIATAFGWLPWRSLQDTGARLLDSSSAIHRWAGLVCYAVNRRDPH